jgi:hypothetical protein
MIRPVIVVVEHQRTKVQRLREYCYELDKTELICVEFSDHVPVTHAGNAFHSQGPRPAHAARYAGQSPSSGSSRQHSAQPGWVHALTEEIRRAEEVSAQ